jgi:hypothetical protein
MAKSPLEWNEADLLALVTEQVEESLDLEYKRSASLQTSEEHRSEIARDISAFANSAGGTIIYGMAEDQSTNLPIGLDDGIDPASISREWLENVIHQRIQPRLEVGINSVRLSESRQGKVAYVVQIPKGNTAYQAIKDKKYYKRYNFKREAMEDYEIKDVMNRLKYPLILPRFAARYVDRSGAIYEYSLLTWLRNDGAMCARDVKLTLAIPQKMSKRVRGFVQQRTEIESPLFGNEWFKNSLIVSGSPLFPDDEVLISELTTNEFIYLVDSGKYDRDESRAPFLLWKTFADDMPPQQGDVYLSQVPRTDE